MTILNTTFHVDARRDSEFLVWVRKVFVPGAAKIVGLHSVRLLRILTEIDADVRGYAVQITLDSQSEAQAWLDDTGSRMLRFISNKMGQQIVYFTTFMEEIDG